MAPVLSAFCPASSVYPLTESKLTAWRMWYHGDRRTLLRRTLKDSVWGSVRGWGGRVGGGPSFFISPFFTVSWEDRSPNFLSSQSNNSLNILQKQYLRTHHMPDYGNKYLHVLSFSVFWNNVALRVQNYACSYFLMKRQSPGEQNTWALTQAVRFQILGC